MHDPVGQGKVDGLVDVEAVVEARVIGAREGDDDLVGPLVARVDGHAGALDPARAHERRELVHEIGRLLEQLGRRVAHRRLEVLLLGPGHAVPRLGRAEVLVVDAAT